MEELPSSSAAEAEAETEPLELLPPPSSPTPGPIDARERSLEAEREDMTVVVNEFPENRRTLAQRRVDNLESFGGRSREAEGGEKWQRDNDREKR